MSLLLLSLLLSVASATSPVPDSWFWGDVDGHNFLTRVQNERAPRYCKGSYALSTAAALSARLKIKRGREYTGPDVVLSTQVILNCAKDDSCSGGNPEEALLYIKQHGLPDETCQNFEGKQGTCDDLGICRDCTHGKGEDILVDAYCWPVKKYNKWTVSSFGKIPNIEGTGIVESMKIEIFNNGPVTCRMSPTTDFLDYETGILSDSATATNEEHWVNVVGWETTSDAKFWIVRNCWGESWGNGGYAKIEMGVNALGLESVCMFGDPISMEDTDTTNGVDDEFEDRGLYRVRKNGPIVDACPCVTIPEDFNPELSFSSPVATNEEIPASYDIRNINGQNYATLDKNQHIPQYCGSCWVFAPLSALADRFALLYGQAPPLFDFAAQVAMDCTVFFSRGCRGGWPAMVYFYVKTHGIPHESCAPYTAVDQYCSALNTCKRCEEDGACDALPPENFRRFGVTHTGHVSGKESMQREIATNGPISCSMAVTDDFLKYAGGIFNDTTCSSHTNHAVEVAGWGEEDGVEYWIIRNSWGTYWGENGWARIAMGDCDAALTYLPCSWATPKPISGELPFQSYHKQPKLIV